MNRVSQRTRLFKLMALGEWGAVKSEFRFHPRFIKVRGGFSVIDWSAIPGEIYKILQCGGKIKRTPYTLQGGVYEEKLPPIRKYPSPPRMPADFSTTRPRLAERIPIRFRLYETQKGRCNYCNTLIPEGDRRWTIDHKLPISRGGTNDDANLVGACYACNTNKGSMTEAEFIKSAYIKSLEL